MKTEEEMKNLIVDQLAAFDQLYREMDEIYHIYAKSCGISDTSMWLLYSLYLNDGTYTQKELYSVWHYPPQTVNSCLKNFEKQGIIKLEAVPGNRKNKLVALTEKGKDESRRIIARLIGAEQRACADMGAKEMQTLLSLTGKYMELLRSEVDQISDISSKE